MAFTVATTLAASPEKSNFDGSSSASTFFCAALASTPLRPARASPTNAAKTAGEIDPTYRARSTPSGETTNVDGNAVTSYAFANA